MHHPCRCSGGAAAHLGDPVSVSSGASILFAWLLCRRHPFPPQPHQSLWSLCLFAVGITAIPPGLRWPLMNPGVQCLTAIQACYAALWNSWGLFLLSHCNTWAEKVPERNGFTVSAFTLHLLVVTVHRYTRMASSRTRGQPSGLDSHAPSSPGPAPKRSKRS